MDLLCKALEKSRYGKGRCLMGRENESIKEEKPNGYRTIMLRPMFKQVNGNHSKSHQNPFSCTNTKK